MSKVAIFIGSINDEKTLRPASDVLTTLGIDHVFTVTSAHRSPERTSRLVRELEAGGCQVFICAAGMAAHLAGVVAAQTTKPVLGVPIANSSLGGLDALLSMVQMPPGIPVGTLGLDAPGAKNAAYFAAQILALQDPALAQRLASVRKSFQTAIEDAAARLEAGTSK